MIVMGYKVDKDALRQVIIDQQSTGLPDNFVSRTLYFHLEDYFTSDECVILTGVRRCGKSTLLQYLRSLQSEKNYYLNFDDDRLASFTIEDFQTLFTLFIELFGEQKYFYFDEIQNIPEWERFVRRLHDSRKKIFITGSNATMLSRELGTRLTGRYIQLEIYPFSFIDFLRFKNYPVKKTLSHLSTSDRALLKKEFNEYREFGGFPEYILSKNKQRLIDLHESILYRDIMIRHKVVNERTFKILALYLASNIGKTMTFNSLKSMLSIKSSTTIAEYCYYIQNSFLITLVTKFDFSLKKQVNTAKKIYYIDLAMASVVGFRTSQDYGRFLENLVFLELKRRGYKEIFYHAEKHECAFIVTDKHQVIMAIQVTQFIAPHNQDREIAGLIEAIKKYSPPTVLLLTEDQETTLIHEQYSIQLLPVWKWLLQPDSSTL